MNLTELKHTPGPWEAKEEYDGWSVIAKREKKAYSVVTYYVCKEIEQGYDMGEADAKLIAAAPDLLEALEVIHNNDFAAMLKVVPNGIIHRADTYNTPDQFEDNGSYEEYARYTAPARKALIDAYVNAIIQKATS